jgi:hypothetical protein
MTSASINIAILLRKSWRTSEGIARVQEIASALGIHPSTRGRASIAGKVSPELFVKLFSVSPIPVEPTKPGADDFGSAGGYTTDRELPIPPELEEYVESISVIPPARRLF